MSTQYYLRVRGRVLGPYDQEKLQSLAQKGQLSRMHEVSTDGATWSRAAAFSEIFTAVLPTLTQPTGNGSAPDEEAELTVEEAPAKADVAVAGRPPQPGSQAWHYISGGVECGPVEFSNLQMLAGTGQLAPDDLVWTQGMQNWSPARQVAGLVRVAAATATSTASNLAMVASGVELPESLCRSAVDARGWAFCIAVLAFIYAAIQTVMGIALLAGGGGTRNGLIIAQGIFLLIMALLIAAGGTLLATYGSRLGGLRYSRMSVILERALDSLKLFWIFASICLIVMLAFFGVVFVYALSIGFTLPSRLN